MKPVCSRSDRLLEHLDRGVLLMAVGGVIFNGMEGSLAGMALTALAAAIYGLTRNRIANLDGFEGFESVAPRFAPPGVDLARFTLICQWLGSRQIFEGLLGDLVDPEIGATETTARRHIRSALWPALAGRLRDKIVSLLSP
ncbi:hypothetical protein sS8_2538 [Methylocaldum marinum]|uniref:Uncharacterized protein n=1 Tax=Methylocaldum marinum TaxID=1432792 RepID=A0A250KS53_9GAMM|nr:hypothetical protein [Methylocaldum marinum]BBA34490.1 hypothetical protein sS8_2538 [Methylocaldum marinum]